MVDTSSWIDRVIERVNDHPDYHISIETDIKLESIYIDPKFMDLVLENLLNNAAKYGADTARLTVKNQANAAVITVEDNGKGIPDNQKAEIFLPFVRLKGNDNVSGFGIGLSFVQAVVEMHNGSIKVMDNDMGGVTFLISLPLPIIEE
ncbi:Histidine kinase/HSP90-like ATPase [Bartonella choladocola]